MSELHDLLPWYANGTLGADERTRFEAHLPTCSTCAQELAVLQRMQSRLQEEGDVLLSDHPSPEHLVAAVAPGPDDAELDPDALAAARRHLALCASCTGEVRWARTQASAVRLAARPDPAAAGRRWGFGQGVRWVLPWGWAAAAALLVLMVAWPERPAAPGAPARVHVIRPAVRAEAGARVVAVPGSSELYLMFPVDVAPDAFPLRFEIVEAAGPLVHRIDAVHAEDLSGGLSLFLPLPARRLPPGAYVGRFHTANANLPPLDYPFRVEAGE